MYPSSGTPILDTCRRGSVGGSRSLCEKASSATSTAPPSGVITACAALRFSNSSLHAECVGRPGTVITEKEGVLSDK